MSCFLLNDKARVLTYRSTASDASRRYRTPAGLPTSTPSFQLVVKNLQKNKMSRLYLAEDENMQRNVTDRNMI